MKRILSALAALCMAGTLCACGQVNTDTGVDSGNMPEVTAPDIEVPSMTVPDISVTNPDIDLPDTSVPETRSVSDLIIGKTITDESGEFTYSGELRQIGDDEHGYIQVPADFVNFKDTDVDGLVQASDRTGRNIITINHYASVDHETLANSMRAQLESDTKATGITGAKVAPNGYEALQIYCYYPDDRIFLVAFSVKDPADDKSSYFLTIEFDSEHQYLMACSSTLRSAEDYHKENG